MRSPSRVGVIISGVLLAGIPLLAIASHLHIESQDIRFEIPSALVPRANVDNIDIWSEINELDLSEMSGTDAISRWDDVYIHMATGPNLIAYPFAVTHDRPETHKDGYAFSIRATVIDKADKIITLRYNFESFLPTRELRPRLQTELSTRANIELAVNKHGVARLVAIKLDGLRYPYRVMDSPVFEKSFKIQ
jgi:hypothetical protein